MDRFVRYGRDMLMTAAVLAMVAAGSIWLHGLGKKPRLEPAPVYARSGPFPDTLVDNRDGRIYRLVAIGGRTWTAQNLNYKTDDSWCYGNDNLNCDKYGRLYSWEAARRACPAGWRLPTYRDWGRLIKAADESSAAGKMLKAASGWGKSGNGTDVYRFSAMPGGYRNIDGSFNSIGTDGTYWADTEYDGDESSAYGRYMDSGFDYAKDVINHKNIGLSVRCVPADSNTFRDPRDGKIYEKTNIGNQTWMAENLDYGTDGSWCYNNNFFACAMYGRLYSWEAANAACPPEWHLPSGKEWDNLALAVGGEREYNEKEKTVSWDNVNSKLRAESGWDQRFRVHWKDMYGFSALPIGRRNPNGTFDPIYGDGWGEWWTAAASGGDTAFIRRVSYYRDYLDEYGINRSEGLPIRCVQNGK
ncbi:MAG: hypothetical protein LBB74_04060 [Chitinispirillales bacterium]|nr:hypothetical protein [Chitinispirillales bacterium]